MSGTQPAPSVTQPDPWWIKPGLAALTILVFAGALVGTAFIKNDTLQVTMFTTAGVLAAAAVNYFFSGASGRSQTDAALVKVATAPAAAPVELIQALKENTVATVASAAAVTTNAAATNAGTVATDANTVATNKS